MTYVGLVVLAVACLAGWIYWRSGLYGFNTIASRGATTWATVTKDDPRLSPAIRMALEDPVPVASPGKLEWREVAPGLEVADLPVIARGIEIDTIHLSRIDTAKFHFRVLTAPAGNMDLDAWLSASKASVIINGSVHSDMGTPDTPVLSDGRQLGPLSYTASHGVFVANDTSANLRDLVTVNWQNAIVGATQAMVSFPLLITYDGSSRTQRSDRRWLANRSFVAQDAAGRIVVGTTKEAFFSLDRLGAFLRAAPLELKLALNLVGGPRACQAVATDKVVRNVCGKWETQTRADEIKLQGQLFGSKRWTLPMVLAAFPR